MSLIHFKGKENYSSSEPLAGIAHLKKNKNVESILTCLPHVLPHPPPTYLRQPRQTAESVCTRQLCLGLLTPPDFVDPKGPEVGA